MEKESDLEGLIEQQFEVLQKAFKIPLKASEARLMISKKFLSLFRVGKLGPSYLMMSRPGPSLRPLKPWLEAPNFGKASKS